MLFYSPGKQRFCVLQIFFPFNFAKLIDFGWNSLKIPQIIFKIVLQIIIGYFQDLSENLGNITFQKKKKKNPDRLTLLELERFICLPCSLLLAFFFFFCLVLVFFFFFFVAYSVFFFFFFCLVLVFSFLSFFLFFFFFW